MAGDGSNSGDPDYGVGREAASNRAASGTGVGVVGVTFMLVSWQFISMFCRSFQ